MSRFVWLFTVLLLSITFHITTATAADAPPEVALTLDKHRFSPEEIRVKANTPFALVITNKDSSEEEFEIASLRIEKIIPGGKTLPLKMPALKPGVYEFVGEFHETTAKGRLVAE